MSRIMQNLVSLKQPLFVYNKNNQIDISGMAGNMHLNRFCIDEDTAFEVSGVYNLNNDSKAYLGRLISLPDLDVRYFMRNKAASGK